MSVKLSGYTPGPWSYRKTTANYNAGFHVEGPGGGAIAGHATEANAALIAQAPTLLEQRGHLAVLLRAALDNWVPTLTQVSENDFGYLQQFRAEAERVLREVGDD